MGIGLLLLGNLSHVEVGLAVELAGFELLCLLDVHAVATPRLGLDEVAGSLTADSAGGNVGNLRARHQRVHVLIEVDGSYAGNAYETYEYRF